MAAEKSIAQVILRGRESLAIYPSQASWFPLEQLRWAPGAVSGLLRSDREMILRYTHTLSLVTAVQATLVHNT